MSVVSSEDQDELVLEINPSNLSSYCQARAGRLPLTDEKSLVPRALASDKVVKSGPVLDHWGDPTKALNVEKEFERLLKAF